MRRYIRFWIWLGVGLILSACGNGGSDSPGTNQLEVSPGQLNLLPNEQVQFTAVLKGPSGAAIDNPAISWESSDPSIVTVDQNGLATGVKLGVASILATASNLTEAATVGVVSPNPGGVNFDLSGKVLYEDRPFDAAGFTGHVEPKPVRNAVVNVIAINGFALIVSGSTDANGDFSFTGLTNSQPRGGIYLQVLAKTAEGKPTQVEIRNNTTDDAVPALVSAALDDTASAPLTGVDITAPAGTVGGAFNILDTFSIASELIQSSGPCPSDPAPVPCLPPLLIAYWEQGSAEGTYYDDQLDAIFILGGGSEDQDADEYDDAVIAHEFGHFAMRHFSRDDSPGGEHRIQDNAQDIRLSYSEGWGNFFSSAVRNSPLYVDTAGSGTFSFNLENYTSPNIPTPGSLSGKTVYTTSEIAVAGVLWDIFDPVAGLDLTESHDQLDLGFNPIWQTILQIQGTGPEALPATMESFQIFFNTVAPGSAGAFQTILQERKMELAPDAAEAAESPLAAGQTQHHTLYQSGSDPAGDVDQIPFNVETGKSYTIETLNLTNGADTLLTIIEQTTTRFENDNRNRANYKNCAVNSLGKSTCPPNDQTTLSSSITFVWSGQPITLFAQVRRSPNAPPSAGRLGTYDIQLKQNN